MDASGGSGRPRILYCSYSFGSSIQQRNSIRMFKSRWLPRFIIALLLFTFCNNSCVNTTRALICLVSLHNNYNNTRSAVLQYKEQEEYSIYRHNPLIAKQQTLHFFCTQNQCQWQCILIFSFMFPSILYYTECHTTAWTFDLNNTSLIASLCVTRVPENAYSERLIIRNTWWVSLSSITPSFTAYRHSIKEANLHPHRRSQPKPREVNVLLVIFPRRPSLAPFHGKSQAQWGCAQIVAPVSTSNEAERNVTGAHERLKESTQDCAIAKPLHFHRHPTHRHRANVAPKHGPICLN